MNIYSKLKFFHPELNVKSSFPFFLTGVQAGFPSPADNPIEEKLDLHQLLIKNPASTFFVRVEGTSMKNANIHDGDILVIDRALTPQNGKIVLAVLNNEFTVKRIQIEGEKIFLLPENPLFPRIEVTPLTDFQIWGVVSYIIHKAK